MSDTRLRELERRWRETGAAEDGAAWLGARVRAGELSEERLRLAAHLGEPAAQMALGEDPTHVDPAWAWVKGLEAWGWEALFRAGIAACAGLVEVWKLENPDDDRFEVAISRCRQYLSGPSETRAEEAHDAAGQLPDASPISRPVNRAARALRYVGRSLILSEEGRRAQLEDGLRYAHMTSQPDAFREAVQRALLPWALR